MWFKQEQEKVTWSPDKPLFETLLSSIDYGVVVYDPDFNILIFNKGAEEIFKVPAQKVVGQKFSLEKTKDPAFKIFSQVMYSSLAPTVVHLSEVGVFPQALKIILEDPAGELETYTNQIIDNQNQLWGYLKLVKDKTREKALLKAKSEFITVAAHQLRTPATAVSWSFENLDKDQTLGANSKELVTVGHKAAKNLSKVVNDLLNVTQIEEGKFGYQFQEINLIEFLDKLLAEATPVAKAYQVSVYFKRPQDQEVKVFVDPVRLGLAISNLVDNAIKYNIPNGQVTVTVGKKDGVVEVAVQDTGVGIPEEDLSKLFTKFFRSTNVAKFSVEGSGLGLYIVKNIIAEHGGKIWAESVINRGSTFYFTLPIKAD